MTTDTPGLTAEITRQTVERWKRSKQGIGLLVRKLEDAAAKALEDKTARQSEQDRRRRTDEEAAARREQAARDAVEADAARSDGRRMFANFSTGNSQTDEASP